MMQASVGELPKDGAARFVHSKAREREDVDVGGWSYRDNSVRTIPASDSGLKPKDLVGMPWRVAFALQAEGWWLRSDIVWAKPNPMPESVTDRPTKAHEYIFLMTKAPTYFYDSFAVRGPPSSASLARIRQPNFDNQTGGDKDYIHGINPNRSVRKAVENFAKNPGRNLRTVWTMIPTQAYPEAHFATFPEALVEPCIKAGTSEKGCCVTCGTPWERVVVLVRSKESGSGRAASKRQAKQWPKGWMVGKGAHGAIHPDGRTTQSDAEDYRASADIRPKGKSVINSERNDLNDRWDVRLGPTIATRTIRFQPVCAHDGDPVACIILDPFAGSGTVGAVARSLGRSAILIEIKEQYVALARQRARTDLSTLDGFGAFGAAP